MIVDDKPKVSDGQSNAMKLGNELKDYISETDDKIYLFVVDPKIIKIK